MIKGWVWADGREQRDFLCKYYTTSPTVSTEGLVLSLIIYVIEVPDVATVEIPGALLQTDYNKGYINIKMEGVMVTLMEEIDPAYYKGFVYLDSRGKKCMYAEAKKAIYGNLEASHIFWTKLSKSL